MILCVGTTPAVQRVMIFRKLALDEVNRASSTLDGVAGKSINVAKVLKSLGEEPVAVSFLGGDRGAYLREVMGFVNQQHIPLRRQSLISAFLILSQECDVAER